MTIEQTKSLKLSNLTCSCPGPVWVVSPSFSHHGSSPLISAKLRTLALGSCLSSGALNVVWVPATEGGRGSEVGWIVTTAGGVGEVGWDPATATGVEEDGWIRSSSLSSLKPDSPLSMRLLFDSDSDSGRDGGAALFFETKA